MSEQEEINAINREVHAERSQLCESCRFWKHPLSDMEEEHGECRTKSPVISVDMADRYHRDQLCDEDDEDLTAPDWIAHRGWWPLTAPEDWCGEWKNLQDLTTKPVSDSTATG